MTDKLEEKITDFCMTELEFYGLHEADCKAVVRETIKQTAQEIFKDVESLEGLAGNQEAIWRADVKALKRRYL